MKAKKYWKKQYRKKKFLKGLIALLQEENVQYTLLIWQEYDKVFIGGEDIREFREQLRKQRKQK